MGVQWALLLFSLLIRNLQQILNEGLSMVQRSTLTFKKCECQIKVKIINMGGKIPKGFLFEKNNTAPSKKQKARIRDMPRI